MLRKRLKTAARHSLRYDLSTTAARRDQPRPTAEEVRQIRRPSLKQVKTPGMYNESDRGRP